MYLRQLDIKKGAGPDGIPPMFWRNCRSQLSEPITELYIKSLQTGVMPKLWKESFVTPVYKSGNKHDIENYRPISKINTVPKLFEKIICDQITLSLAPSLMQEQHGFVSGKSAESNLVEFLDGVLSGMEDGYQVDAIYTDYSKAFDKVSHSLLLGKLASAGIQGDLLRWVASYLRDRCQAVAIKGFCSSFIPITSGVPQGSHLGPLFFNIFINDIASRFHSSSCLLYADDNKIFKVIKCVEDCRELQEDLSRLYQYCQINCLHLNIKKCNVITFSRKRHVIRFSYHINNKLLNRVNNIKDLGIHQHSKLLFVPHRQNNKKSISFARVCLEDWQRV